MNERDYKDQLTQVRKPPWVNFPALTILLVSQENKNTEDSPRKTAVFTQEKATLEI